MKIWIGNFYPASEMYQENEARTVGKALVNGQASFNETVENRRKIRGVMNMLGLQAVKRAKALVKARLGIEPELVFSQKAGCGMCPCSPGFMIKIGELTPETGAKIRDLFSRHAWESLAYTWYGTNKDGSKNWDSRHVEWGVRDVGVCLSGDVKKGKVSVTAYNDEKNTKAMKAIRKILKGK